MITGTKWDIRNTEDGRLAGVADMLRYHFREGHTDPDVYLSDTFFANEHERQKAIDAIDAWTLEQWLEEAKGDNSSLWETVAINAANELKALFGEGLYLRLDQAQEDEGVFPSELEYRTGATWIDMHGFDQYGNWQARTDYWTKAVEVEDDKGRVWTFHPVKEAK